MTTHCGNASRATSSGFTLIELLVVIIILGILLAIAMPSYLSFRTRANVSAAKANVRAAVPGMEAFNADHATGYAGVNLAKLQAELRRGHQERDRPRATPAATASRTPCPGTVTYHKAGPSGDIKSRAPASPGTRSGVAVEASHADLSRATAVSMPKEQRMNALCGTG